MKNSGLRVKRAVKGAGFCLITERPIAKGERIIEYVGDIISDEEYERRGNRYIFAVGKDHNIDGSHRYNLARYINHSCRPNCEAIDDEGRIFIEAKRKIMMGEELTYHYGKWYFDTFIKDSGCRCVKCHDIGVKGKETKSLSSRAEKRTAR